MASNAERVLLVLDFLNGVQTPEEIVERVRDDPEYESRSEQAYGVRPRLAGRILDTRGELPNRQFESLDQLEAVHGLGPDTLHDIFKSVTGGSPPPHGDPSRTMPIADLLPLATEFLRQSGQHGAGGPGSRGEAGQGAGAMEGTERATGRADPGATGPVGRSSGSGPAPGSSESNLDDPEDVAKQAEGTAKYGKGAWRIWLPPAAMLVVGIAVGWFLRGQPTGGGPSVVQLDPRFYSTLDSLVNRNVTHDNDSALILLANALTNWPLTVEVTGGSDSRNAEVPLAFGHSIEIDRLAGDTIAARCLMEGVTVKVASRPIPSMEPSR